MIISLLILLVMGVTVPESSLAGDAMPGMASQGIVRLPVTGMVEQTFGSVRMPGMKALQSTDEASPAETSKSLNNQKNSVKNSRPSPRRLVQKMSSMSVRSIPSTD
ncbi:MAG: hypothetical protein ACPGYT_14545 [Nitrospirales bacterium]